MSGSTTSSATQVDIPEHRNIEEGENHKLEIIKSIVFGGLVESITSLSTVSSAVGGGAAPLNLVAMALANLVVGLLILVDNLIELKSNPPCQDLQKTATDGGRYRQLLGCKENFRVHITVAVLSFLIFGSTPVVIYGFLSHKKYKEEVRLAVLATASLFCIILLASGKVYTRKPPESYVKTISYYVSMSIVASGISYVLGDLLKDLLGKFNQF